MPAGRYLAGEGPLARVPPLVDGQVARSVAAVLAEGALEQLDETQVAAHMFPHLLPVLPAGRSSLVDHLQGKACLTETYKTPLALTI